MQAAQSELFPVGLDNMESNNKCFRRPYTQELILLHWNSSAIIVVVFHPLSNVFSLPSHFPLWSPHVMYAYLRQTHIKYHKNMNYFFHTDGAKKKKKSQQVLLIICLRVVCSRDSWWTGTLCRWKCWTDGCLEVSHWILSILSTPACTHGRSPGLVLKCVLKRKVGKKSLLCPLFLE